ncbi:MAG: transcription-repair coupling factor [Bacteroidota bacterium]
MSIATLAHHFSQGPQQQRLREAIAVPQAKIHLKGLVGSALSFGIADAFKTKQTPFLFILNDKEEAAYYLNDLEQLVGAEQVLFYPGSYRRPYQIEKTDNANVMLRAEVLNRISTHDKPLLVVSYTDALFEKVITRKTLENNTLTISVNDSLSPDTLNELLFEYRFNRVDFVSEPGEFSVRGGIIDVFSFSNDTPYRIEFFGDEVESIRTFDIATQLSVEKVKHITIIPDVENKHTQESRESFLRYIPDNTIVCCKNPEAVFGRMDVLFAKAEETFRNLSGELSHATPETLFCNAKTIEKQLWEFNVLELGSQPWFSKAAPEGHNIAFNTQPQPPFHKKFDVLIANLQQNHKKGITNYILCANDKQARRFHDIFEEMEQHIPYKTLVFSIYQGFIAPALSIACYTDHQIFERYHKFRLKSNYTKKQALTLKELTNLRLGDYVAHIDHGIGKFGGLQKIEIEGKIQEAIKLIYGDRDVLYVSIHSLHKISKYNGKDGKIPKIYKLGSTAWKTLKQKTKARVKAVAFSLIELYAKRKLQKGFRYAPDSYLQHELEASFLYEDTPDQSKATLAVKTDMESEYPMDRLVCGDVGFGKTEIAIRAAFKAVDNNKQVAVLAPTTILTFQHFRTFSERLKDFPVTVAYINRFRTAGEKKETLKALEEGTIDIIIGTHLLSGKNVKFKNLGLLIVDEEQKFGVAVKEKLKTLKENIDVLTLTATPIPRTLQFSLMAARDLSVINTPPPNRYPIDSQVIHFNEEIIRDAVSYEMQRGGQVFFVHNRIENIKEVGGMLQRLVPDAKIGIAHGQMEGKKLEKLMLAFMNGDYDILVSTSIIENGLDVPNANTIFINNANHFGLSDLHQLRGRVGRSNKKAFCYFITPPYTTMTEDARKRMEALSQFTDLGSGFNIAMKDLEIRGAGDLLGGEQSGFINEMGFETYQKILGEAIEELKENEFKTLYETPENENKKYIRETVLDSDFELLFPDNYINTISERLNLYTELSTLETEAALQRFEASLKDRFGPLPTQASDLLNSVRIKWTARNMGLEKIVLKKGKMVGYFIADQQSDYYQSKTFTGVLHSVQASAGLCKMQEKETRKGLRLLLVFNDIPTVEKALEALTPFVPSKTVVV